MKLFKLALLFGATLAIAFPSIGCSSGTDNKQPKVAGGADVDAKPLGRGASGAPGKPSGPTTQGAVTKD
jgi:hypothetical protein